MHSCGSWTFGWYIPSKVRSSVDSIASTLGSLAISARTSTRVRRTVDGGQLSDAVSKRLAKAAERQEGAAGPNFRGAKIMSKARKSISAKESEVAPPHVSEDDDEANSGASMSCTSVRGMIIAYNFEIKSLGSMFRASPARSGEQCQPGDEQVACGPWPDRTSKAVTIHCKR